MKLIYFKNKHTKYQCKWQKNSSIKLICVKSFIRMRGLSMVAILGSALLLVGCQWHAMPNINTHVGSIVVDKFGASKAVWSANILRMDFDLRSAIRQTEWGVKKITKQKEPRRMIEKTQHQISQKKIAYQQYTQTITAYALLLDQRPAIIKITLPDEPSRWAKAKKNRHKEKITVWVKVGQMGDAKKQARFLHTFAKQLKNTKDLPRKSDFVLP